MLKKNGKSHLIIDMCLLNCYIHPPKFKYQSLHNLATLLQLGDFLFMIDFKDGFFVKVGCSDQCYLCFTWRGQTYVCLTLGVHVLCEGGDPPPP